MEIRVLIVDDHEILRKGLAGIFRDSRDIRVAGEAATGSEALTMLEEGFDCDVVLLDISLPGRGGLDILDQIHRLYPALPALVLTMHSEEQYAVRALQNGASGYVTKGSPPEELCAAIRKVRSGGRYVSPAVAECLALHLNAGQSPPHCKLSDREYRVLRQVAAGKTLKEISEEMSLSIKTVSTYRTRILRKMRMQKTSDMVKYALLNNLVEY